MPKNPKKPRKAVRPLILDMVDFLKKVPTEGWTPEMRDRAKNLLKSCADILTRLSHKLTKEQAQELLAGAQKLRRKIRVSEMLDKFLAKIKE